MIRIGTIAMMVDAIPAEVYFIAIRENDTPRKGPKKDPVVMAVIPFRSFRAAKTVFHLPERVMISMKPIMPVMILIWVDGKGLYSFIPYLLNTMPSACPNAPKKAKRIPRKGLWIAILFLS